MQIRDLRSIQFSRLSALLDVGIELEPAAREQWLSQLAGEDAQSAELLQRILAHHAVAAADGWLETGQGLVHLAALQSRNATFKVCTRSFPALMEAPWMFAVAMFPQQTLFIFENGQVRHVYTNGRTHPHDNDLWPTPLGDSVGHWEGQTLVINTISRAASEPHGSQR
jgi:hypothetical protein